MMHALRFCRRAWRVGLPVLLLIGAGCQQPLTRTEVLRIAERYATHAWRATADNVHHGPDPDGVQLDTPDAGYREGGWRADGQVNVGIPYQWDGYSTIEEFDRGIADGLAAGHLPRSVNRKELPPGSRYAVGVDCSGFISRCWKTDRQYSTRTLPDICVELERFDELLPGDAINRYNSHVMLFVEFTDPTCTRVRTYEAAGTRVQLREHDVARLIEAGYVPLRYERFADDGCPCRNGGGGPIVCR
jgi:hypothetical protein